MESEILAAMSPEPPACPTGDPNLIDRDAIITTLFWCLVQKEGGEYDKDENGNATCLIDKGTLNVNKNCAVQMRDGSKYVRITIVPKG